MVSRFRPVSNLVISHSNLPGPPAVACLCFHHDIPDMSATGTVYLVGAGPGDPGLLTLRGAELLARADVVVYDALVNPALLKSVPETAEIIYGGKRARDHAISQEELNRLLIERARAGKAVVRLKGGDPYVFGRGGEEAVRLADAGI